jgi:tetratricopeptide (TPR) repeat protein
VVAARGQGRPPVWSKSYNALVGLYYAEPTADVNNAFLGTLGDNTIAERLAKPIDRTQQLAGNTWFYYGSRYGEYLGTTKQGSPEDFLPAMLELSPASSSGYLTLADYYAGAGDTERAIADYNHTLELSPNRPEVYDSLAVAYYKRGDRTAAVAQWKQALAVLSNQLNSAHTPESFWTDFGRTCDQLGMRKLFGELQPDADAIVRTYLRHNGNYRSNALLQPAYAAIADPASATTWLLDVSSAAQDPTQILADVVDAPWIPLAQRAPIYRRILQSKQDALGKLAGIERDNTEQYLGSWQVRWIAYLIRTKQYAQAADAIAALSKETRKAQAAALVPLDLRVTAQLGERRDKPACCRGCKSPTGKEVANPSWPRVLQGAS